MYQFISSHPVKIFSEQISPIVSRCGMQMIPLMSNYSYRPISRVIKFPMRFITEKEVNTETILQNLKKEYDRSVAENEEDVEKRAKLLMIRLMQIDNSNEILDLFEEKYIKRADTQVNAEDLCIFIYYYVTLLEKESCLKEKIDPRLKKLIEMLNEVMVELDIAYLLPFLWACSILIKHFDYDIPQTVKKTLILNLPDDLEIHKKGDIPSICFSLASLNSENCPKLKSLIRDRISKYSSYFFGEKGVNYISCLSLSLLTLAWVGVDYSNTGLLDKTVTSLLELKNVITEDNMAEVCKFVWAFAKLNYQNSKVVEFIDHYLLNYLDAFDIISAIDLFISFTTMYPDFSRPVKTLVELILKKEMLEKVSSRLDNDTFCNLWKALAKCYAKGNAPSEISFLMKLILTTYESRHQFRQMDVDMATNLLFTFSLINVQPSRLYDDLCECVKNKLDLLNTSQLTRLMTCGKYLFNSKEHLDLYFILHETCAKKIDSFSPTQVDLLKKIISSDNIIENSPLKIN